MTDELFRDLPPVVALDRQIEAAERELKYRRHVYPRLVEEGRKSQRNADDEIAFQRAVIQTLQRYKYLRERRIDNVSLAAGGVFVGRVPHNIVLNGAEMDAAIDEALAKLGRL